MERSKRVLQVEKYNRNDIIIVIKNVDKYKQIGNIRELKMAVSYDKSWVQELKAILCWIQRMIV